MKNMTYKALTTHTYQYNDNTLYSEYPNSFFHTPEYSLDYIDGNKYLTKTNSLGFRSDEFIKNHNGTHILFAGDCNTMGEGLLMEEVWSNIVYKKISENTKCSGYFNIGVTGSPIYTIVSNIIKYCKNFGNPDNTVPTTAMVAEGQVPCTKI